MKTPRLKPERKRRVRKDEFENEDYDDYDDAEADRMEADDINIDEYLSSDDTPDYKTQTNNYSDDDENHDSPSSSC
jgi:RNA polymerase sigma-54 factor